MFVTTFVVKSETQKYTDTRYLTTYKEYWFTFIIISLLSKPYIQHVSLNWSISNYQRRDWDRSVLAQVTTSH